MAPKKACGHHNGQEDEEECCMMVYSKLCNVERSVQVIERCTKMQETFWQPSQMTTR